VNEPDVVNDFEAWATVSSRLFGKSVTAQKELLTELRVDEVWRYANLAWARAIAADIVEMRLDRAQRYAEICARVLDRELEVAQGSLSDEQGSHTTHRMRAHPPPPAEPSWMRQSSSSESPPSPPRPAFVGSFPQGAVSTGEAAAPKRRQSYTPTVVHVVDGEADETVERGGHEEPSKDSSDTKLIVAPAAAGPVDAEPALVEARPAEPPLVEARPAEPPLDWLDPLSPDHPSRWTVERYASYIAAHEMGAEDPSVIDERFGLADPKIVHQSWSKRLEADPRLEAQVEDLVQRAREAQGTLRHPAG
jgi:hypothetical protein